MYSGTGGLLLAPKNPGFWGNFFFFWEDTVNLWIEARLGATILKAVGLFWGIQEFGVMLGHSHDMMQPT